MSLFLTNSQIQHLAMALLHSLWQAGLVAFVLVVVLRLIPARQANKRYLLCLSAMLMILVSGLVTWGWLEIRAMPLSPEDVSTHEPARQQVTEPAASRINWEFAVVSVWSLGVASMLFRVVFSFCQLKHLKRDSTQPDAEFRAFIERLARECGLQKPIEVLITTADVFN